MKRILIACEESQAVCSEFRKLGYEAYSCDVLPTSGDHPEWHIQDDVMNVLRHDIISPFTTEWDMVIAFPPCTYLTVTANRWLKDQPKPKSGCLVGKDRRDARDKAIMFFEFFAHLKNEFVAIENPVGIMSTLFRKPNQIIQPWMFGDPFEKQTCLWLKGLPRLTPTNPINPPKRYEWIDSVTGRKKSQPEWYAKASQKDGKRGELRSKTFPGIAKAMANQYSKFMENK